MASHHFIRKYKTADDDRLKKYLKKASVDEIHSLCECTLNVCNGNVPVSQRTLNRLKPYARSIKKISQGKVKNKRKYLIQHGGFLPLIASAVLPIIGSLVGELIKNG
jgi:hypothetical protein